MTINFNFTKNSPLILVIERDPNLQLLLRQAMELNDYRVAVASNGQEGLDLAQQLKPDIVLLDAIMPEMDGFECCTQLAILMGEECPTILMMTALLDKASVDRAFAVGATDLIPKPIPWPVLIQRVQRLLAFRSQIAQLKSQIQCQRRLNEILEAANRELVRRPPIDGLTQLANPGSFEEYLQREWKRMLWEKSILSLIFCDVDFLKKYNDFYGLPAGDECLVKIAKVLSETANRPADFIARYGAEEFAILLPNTDGKAAFSLAESIRENLKKRAIPHLNSPISDVVTLSLGISCMSPTPQSSPERLIAAAHSALSQAKKQGRDRTCGEI